MIKIALKASVLFGISEMIQKGSVFLLLPFLTKVLLPSEYGLVSSVLILVASTTVLFSLSSHGVVTRFYNTYSGRVRNAFISTTLTGLLVFCLIFFIVVFIFKNFLNEYYFKGQLPADLLLVVIAIMTTQPIFLFGNAYFKIAVKLKLFLIYYNVYYILQFSGITLFVILLQMSVEFYLYSILFSNLMYLVFFCCYFYSHNGIFLEKRFARRISKYVLLVLPVDLLSITSVFLDRYFIVLFLGFSSVGVYYAAYQLSIIIQIFALGINSAIIPFFYKSLKRNLDNFYNSFYEVYIPFVGLLCFILILTSGTIVNNILSDEYAYAAKLLPILFLSAFFIPIYLLLTNVLTIKPILQLRKLQAAICLLVTNVITTYFLILNYGMLGAALSTLIVNMISVSLFYSIIRYYKIVNLKISLAFKIFIMLAVLTMLLSLNAGALYLVIYSLLSFIYLLAFTFRGMNKKIKKMEIEFASFK